MDDWKKGACLISGVSKGIGEAIAKKLLENGVKVIGFSRSAPNFSHENFSFFPCNMANPAELEAFLKKIKKENIYSLILNAGFGAFGHLEEMTLKQARELFDVNFFAHVMTVKEIIPGFKKVKKGHIIAIGSESALEAKRKGSLYAASKFALRGFIESMRDECESSGIKTTLIHPGMVETPFFDALDFSPGTETDEHLIAQDIAEAAFYALATREGCVPDSIVLSPQKKRILFKNRL